MSELQKEFLNAISQQPTKHLVVLHRGLEDDKLEFREILIDKSMRDDADKLYKFLQEQDELRYVRSFFFYDLKSWQINGENFERRANISVPLEFSNGSMSEDLYYKPAEGYNGKPEHEVVWEINFPKLPSPFPPIV